MILICTSIGSAFKDGKEGSEFGFPERGEPRVFKSLLPNSPGEEMGESYRKCQKIGKIAKVFYHHDLASRFA
jgi:hypothetical protein